MRTVDRVEAVVMLLAAPLAATAVGTAVHHSRSDLYAGQPRTRQAPPRA
ncbi:MAG TPA: hypothetical protein VE197_13085 [Mycobacterium sp.]|nr:hypothetical protein [Mycobacterium sp.]